ncbi:ABC transporter ATP-binding protein [Nocardiopsis salina]|uniref:ABC transporter ATP-binding protein n=1 Tax=Nocardiopsis salina TaxID=245836 RepID=UPI0003811466|nr:ABC transporter ATP-binding protein [Nocardiopsis salina]
MTTDEPQVSVDQVTARFGRTTILDGISLCAPAGLVHVLLGHNGAGKSTLLKMVSTSIRPKRGRISVQGLDTVADRRRVRQRIALVRQEVQLDLDASGLDNIRLQARLLGHDGPGLGRRCREILASVGLEEDSDKLVRVYSGGMRRKLDIVLALVGAPSVLLLDEPTVGLDPESKYQVWELIRRISTEGRTVLMSTQQLDEAQALADHISLLSQGRLVVSGSVHEIRASVGRRRVEVLLQQARHAQDARCLLRAHGYEDIDVVDTVRLTGTSVSEDDVHRCARLLQEAGVLCKSVSIHPPSISDVYSHYGYGGRVTGEQEDPHGDRPELIHSEA